MKIVYGLLFFAISAHAESEVRITFKVLSNDDLPVQGAELSVSMFDHWESGGGSGFGTDVHKSQKLVTDGSGKAVLQASTSRGKLTYRAKAAGYYRNDDGALEMTEARNGRWQPWDRVETIKLFKMLHPVPLCARRLGYGFGKGAEKIPVFGKPAGFDLELSDWVAPYGGGKVSDLIFQMDGATNDLGKPFSSTLKIQFSNAKDGICTSKLPDHRLSALRTPYEAPDDQYVNEMAKIQSRQVGRNGVDDEIWSGKPDPQMNYFLRLRSKVGADGKLESANYGKIYGDFEWYPDGSIRFQYYFNPRPNERNLEFDRSHNLLKVAEGEEVPQP